MRLLSVDELLELLDRFGMRVQLDPEAAAFDGVSRELLTARLAHALVGIVETHATHAEEAARRTGADVSDIAEVALMAFAGANPRSGSSGTTRRNQPPETEPCGRSC